MDDIFTVHEKESLSIRIFFPRVFNVFCSVLMEAFKRCLFLLFIDSRKQKRRSSIDSECIVCTALIRFKEMNDVKATRKIAFHSASCWIQRIMGNNDATTVHQKSFLNAPKMHGTEAEREKENERKWEAKTKWNRYTFLLSVNRSIVVHLHVNNTVFVLIWSHSLCACVCLSLCVSVRWISECENCTSQSMLCKGCKGEWVENEIGSMLSNNCQA